MNPFPATKPVTSEVLALLSIKDIAELNIKKETITSYYYVIGIVAMFIGLILFLKFTWTLVFCILFFSMPLVLATYYCRWRVVKDLREGQKKIVMGRVTKKLVETEPRTGIDFYFLLVGKHKFPVEEHIFARYKVNDSVEIHITLHSETILEMKPVIEA